MAKKKMNFKTQIFMAVGLVMAIVFLPSTILLLVGMAPTLVLFFTDHSRRKTKTITVGAMNLAGCSYFLFELWKSGHSFEESFAIFSDFLAIITMYVAAGAGYLIDWTVTGATAGILYQRNEARKRAITKRHGELVERWGKKVTGEIPLDDQGFPLEEDAPPEDEEDRPDSPASS